MQRATSAGLAAAAAAVGAIVLAGAPERIRAEAAGEPLAATMQRVLAGLSAVLPLALDEARTPAEERFFERKLAELAEAARGVDHHAAGRGASFALLSRSLADDLASVNESWKRGEHDAAGYFLVQTTSNCVACHSRLPGQALAPLSEEIERVIGEDSTSVHERAQLLVATRQFDRALTAWEGLFADPEFSPDQLDVGGYLLDYLTVAIRVRGAHERARAQLVLLAERPETPLYLRRLLAGWSEQLATLATSADVPAAAPRDKVAAARALIEAATRQSDFAAGRERIVADLQASAWLLQHLDAAEPRDPRNAEALYLLGVVEARSVEGYWVPQADAHLEAAVVAAPSGPFAERAYALLEEYWALSFGGVSDPHLPPDYEKRLHALQKLMAAAAAPARPARRSQP